jgi:hypothetical protein
VAGIAFSRDERRDELAAGPSLTPPVANRDHWHAAYGVLLCDQLAPPIQDQRDPKGIHTHGDGLIHVHPFVRAAAGDNATLGVFADAVKMTITDSELKVPGGKSFREGRNECAGKPGIVQVKVNDRVVTTDVRDVKLDNRAVIMIAFAPEGAELPVPPSVGELARPSDLLGGDPTAPGATTEDPEATTEDPEATGEDPEATTETPTAPATSAPSTVPTNPSP